MAVSQTVKEINTPVVENLDEVTPFHDGLAAVRRGNQWGFIDTSGKLVIEFRDDLIWNIEVETATSGVGEIEYPRFNNGLCPFKISGEEDIPLYGFINRQGKVAISPEYLNITEFKDGLAVGIYFKKTFRGKSDFQLNIYDQTFTEVVLNTKGEMVWPVTERQNILMSKRRYERPEIRTKVLNKDLIAVRISPEQWEIRRFNLAQ
jgi:hypothetical protein